MVILFPRSRLVFVRSFLVLRDYFVTEPPFFLGTVVLFTTRHFPSVRSFSHPRYHLVSVHPSSRLASFSSRAAVLFPFDQFSPDYSVPTCSVEPENKNSTSLGNKMARPPTKVKDLSLLAGDTLMR